MLPSEPGNTFSFPAPFLFLCTGSLLALAAGKEHFSLLPNCRYCVRSSELSEKEKKYVENILSILESDSAKHKETVKILFEKFEDVLTTEHEMAQAYEECLGLTEDMRIISELSKLREDEIEHIAMARRLLEITQG